MKKLDLYIYHKTPAPPSIVNATMNEERNRGDNEFDPFQNVKQPLQTIKASNFDSPHPESRNGDNPNSNQQRGHPFSRDMIDSMLTVVDKDLLFCKLFYFFFFGAFGSLFPLLAIYFKQLGMNASQSGVLIGFRPFIEFLSAPFWGGLADKWRRGKEMLLFALLCWIMFTLAIAFVQPPAHKCINFNGTHNILEGPLARRRRDVEVGGGANFNHPIISHFGDDDVIYDKRGHTLLRFPHGSNMNVERVSLVEPGHELSGHILSPAFSLFADPDKVFDHDGMDHVIGHEGEGKDSLKRGRRSPYTPGAAEIANSNGTDFQKLVFSRHSTVVYHKDEVQHAFFILLLLVVIGEFFR